MPNPICNTSPLQYLHQINQIDLLPKIYGSIRIPQAVADEIATGLQNNNDLPYLEDLYWLSVRPNEENVDLSQFPSGLGKGEIQVISSGFNMPDEVLILDDRLARQFATKSGLKVTGTVGILLSAKQRGMITSIKPSLDHLTGLGFRISPDIYHKGLNLAGETFGLNR